MKTARTRGTLLARLERLGSRAQAGRGVTIRSGYLRQLPKDYKGERHVVAVRERPDQGVNWVDFEEVPGPDPNPGPAFIRGVPVDLDILFVDPPHWEATALSDPGEGATG